MEKQKNKFKVLFITFSIMLSTLLLLSFVFNIINLNNKNNMNANEKYIFSNNRFNVTANKPILYNTLIVKIGSGEEEQVIYADIINRKTEITGIMELTRKKYYEFKEPRQLITLNVGIMDNGTYYEYVDTNYIYLTKKEKVYETDEICYYYLDSNGQKQTTWNTKSTTTLNVTFQVYL